MQSTHLFALGENNDFSEKINLDGLFEKKQQDDLKSLQCFQKILGHIHKKIKIISRQQNTHETHCWFLIPPMVLGMPRYDSGACTAFLINKLEANGFVVKYIHPNVLFISWGHIIPSYVRNEYQKQTGITIDQYGQKVQTEEENDESGAMGSAGSSRNANANANGANKYHVSFDESSTNGSHEKVLVDMKRSGGESFKKKNPKKEYTPVETYRPTGNLLYNHKMTRRFL